MGVYLVNYAFAAVVLVGLIFGYLWWLNTHDAGGSLLPVIIAAEVVAVVLPLAMYPIAKSVWAAVDLAIHPLDPVDEAEAELHAAPAPPTSAPGASPPVA
jgi:hypothetical protein